MAFDFTIVTPSFNGGSYIGDAIRSVITQKDVAIEYIIQDNSSDDNTKSVIEMLRRGPEMRAFEGNGSKFTFRSERDSGQSNAINRGLANAQGEYMAWLNADDFYYAGSLARAKAILETMKAKSLIFGDINYVRADKSIIKIRRGFKYNQRVLRNVWCYIPQPSAFWSRELWQSTGPLDESLQYAMDYDYWLRCSERGEIRYDPHLYAGYRLLPSTKTGASPRIAMPETLKVARQHGAFYITPMRLIWWSMRLGIYDLSRKIAKIGRKATW